MNSPGQNLRPRLVAIFFLALTIRILFIWIQASFHVFDIYFVASDSRLYEALAQSLLSGSGYSILGKPTALVTPGYPIFLAVLHRVGIDSALAIGFVQSVLGAMTCVFIAVLAGRLSGTRTATIAGILSAFYVHFVFWTGYVLTETLFVFFVVVSLVALLRWQEDVVSYARAVLAGIVLAFGALTRPHLVLFAVLATGYVGASATRRREAVLSSFVLLLTLAAILSLWVVRNYRVFGVPIAGSTLSGEVLYQGNSEGATGGTGGYVDARDFTRLGLSPNLSELEVNRAYSRAARDFMLQHPTRLPGLAVRKFINMWRPTYTGASARNFLIFGGSYLFVVAFFVVGVVRSWRRGFGTTGQLLLLCLGFFAALHLVVPGMIRYRLPAEPVLVVFAAAGIECALNWLPRTGWRPSTSAV